MDSEKKSNFIILGAGPPYTGDDHVSLKYINSSVRVLDWQIKSIGSRFEDICFVGGYKIDNVVSSFPNLL